jgi:hypothetical protein
MPHITTHTVQFTTPITEGSKVKVWHCAIALFLTGCALGYLIA